MASLEEIVLVFGGAQGIGQSCCESLLHRGYKVVISDIKKEQGEQAVNEFKLQIPYCQVAFVESDVTIESSVKGAFAFCKSQFGSNPGIVVNSAGVVLEGNEWKKTINTNLIGTIIVVHEAISAMSKENGGNGGQVVALASVTGLIPFYTTPVYSASKFGVNGYIRSMGNPNHFAITGIRFNSICPTVVDTTFAKFNKKENTIGVHERLYDKFVSDITQIDKLSPADVAKCLTDLINDEAANGRCLLVNKASGVTYMDLLNDIPQ